MKVEKIGILYITKLNTDYDKYTNTVSVNPEILKYRYYTGEGYGRLGIENSVAAYANLLYFADNNGDIQCIDLRKMEPIWVIEGLDDIEMLQSQLKLKKEFLIYM